MSNLVWYSINKDLNPVEHAPVELAEAIEIARRYHVNGMKKYPTPEDGAVETMFGFQRSKDTWIQFTVDAPDDITFIFEMPRYPGRKKKWYESISNYIVQHHTAIGSLTAMESIITDFFTLEPAAFRDKTIIDTAA